jgi:DNA-binding XRE family transcriptional regulator
VQPLDDNQRRPKIDDFKRWRAELGKTEQEIADLAGISADEYAAVERASSPAEMPQIYFKICSAFRELGKEIPAVTAHSSLN